MEKAILFLFLVGGLRAFPIGPGASVQRAYLEPEHTDQIQENVTVVQDNQNLALNPNMTLAQNLALDKDDAENEESEINKDFNAFELLCSEYDKNYPEITPIHDLENATTAKNAEETTTSSDFEVLPTTPSTHTSMTNLKKMIIISLVLALLICWLVFHFRIFCGGDGSDVSMEDNNVPVDDAIITKPTHKETSV